MLIVPWMRVNKLLVSSFEDEGYGMMVRSGQVFMYQRDDPIGTHYSVRRSQGQALCFERAHCATKSKWVAVIVKG